MKGKVNESANRLGIMALLSSLICMVRWIGVFLLRVDERFGKQF